MHAGSSVSTALGWQAYLQTVFQSSHQTEATHSPRTRTA